METTEIAKLVEAANELAWRWPERAAQLWRDLAGCEGYPPFIFTAPDGSSVRMVELAGVPGASRSRTSLWCQIVDLRGVVARLARADATQPDASVSRVGVNLSYAAVLAGLSTWRPDSQICDRPLCPEPPSSPGPCPRCSIPERGPMHRRERGEVRTHVWRCGCPIEPYTVHLTAMRPDGHGGWRESGPGELGRNPAAFEFVWEALDREAVEARLSRHGREAGVRAYGPTKEAAIVAWRAQLEQAQRAEDAAAGHVERDGESTNEVHEDEHEHAAIAATLAVRP